MKLFALMPIDTITPLAICSTQTLVSTRNFDDPGRVAPSHIGFAPAGPPPRAGVGFVFSNGLLLMDDDVIRYRAMAAFCRQRAKMEGENEEFWLREAENWVTRLSSVSVDPLQKQTNVPGAGGWKVSDPSQTPPAQNVQLMSAIPSIVPAILRRIN